MRLVDSSVGIELPGFIRVHNEGEVVLIRKSSIQMIFSEGSNGCSIGFAGEEWTAACDESIDEVCELIIGDKT